MSPGVSSALGTPSSHLHLPLQDTRSRQGLLQRGSFPGSNSNPLQELCVVALQTQTYTPQHLKPAFLQLHPGRETSQKCSVLRLQGSDNPAAIIIFFLLPSAPELDFSNKNKHTFYRERKYRPRETKQTWTRRERARSLPPRTTTYPWCIKPPPSTSLTKVTTQQSPSALLKDNDLLYYRLRPISVQSRAHKDFAGSEPK